MLTSDELKTLLFEELSRSDKLLLLLTSFDTPCGVQCIRKKAYDLGYRKISKWNISDILSRTNGRAVNTKDGWEITKRGRDRLGEIGFDLSRPRKLAVAHQLRECIARTHDSQIRSFIIEAITCFEYGLFRSAIIMSWIGAIAILRDEVRKRHIEEFNKFIRERSKSKKDQVNFSRYLDQVRDSEFVDILFGISMIDKSVQVKLKHCLDNRNQCSHPNNLCIGENTVASHLEILILNVYDHYK